MQIQERLTNQIADTIREKLSPLGVAVVMEATHLVHVDARRREAELVRGDERDARRVPNNARTRMEFLELIKLQERLPAYAAADETSPRLSLACIGDD